MKLSQEVQAFSILSYISALWLNSAVTAPRLLADFSDGDTYYLTVILQPAPTDN